MNVNAASWADIVDDVPDEIDPDIQGDWRLRDSERSAHIDVSISANILHAYRERFTAFTRDLEAKLFELMLQ